MNTATKDARAGTVMANTATVDGDAKKVFVKKATAPEDHTENTLAHAELTAVASRVH